MKRTLSLILALMLVLCSIPVLGLASLRPVKDLPREVRSSLKSKFGDYDVTDYDYGNNFLFVGLERNGSNTLAIYRIGDNGDWYYWARTTKGVPQSSTGTLHVDVDYGYWDHCTGKKKYDYSTLHLCMMNDQGYVTTEAWYSNTSGVVWKLMRYFRQSHNYGVTVGNTSLTYYSGASMTNRKGTVDAEIQRDLRYASLSSIPKSLSEAQDKYAPAEELPASSELQATEINFTGGKKYPVYTAPNNASIRSANGKASVSTNGWIQVFGTEDGYAMIQYSIDAGHYRIGYITASALPSGANVSALHFRYTPATVTQTTTVTDDPFHSESPIATVYAGDAVTLLAISGEWSYIENYNYRGFVRSTCLDTGSGYGTSNTYVSTEDEDVG